MASAPPPERPLLISFPVPLGGFQPTGGGSRRVRTPDPEEQDRRIGDRVRGLLDAFSAGDVQVDAALPARDPELVVVFEVIDMRADIVSVAQRVGLEVLVEAEDEFDPDSDFPRINKEGALTESVKPVGGCLHAICASRSSAEEVVRLWSVWKKDKKLQRNFGALADLFSHLRDVRFWDAKDRLRMNGLEEYLAGLLDGQVFDVEVELWFRRSEDARGLAAERVRALIVSSDGRVVSEVVHAEVGYHALHAELPVSLIRRLSTGEFADISLVRSADVLYLKASGQTVDDTLGDVTDEVQQLPPVDLSETPVLCVLDGVPVANHPRLAGRVHVLDSDDLGGNELYSVNLRRHGTAMASVAIWGDLSVANAPLERPVLLRPILTVAEAGVEEIDPRTLTPDLMMRVFRELFESDNSLASGVGIVNLSVGDPSAPFDSFPSSWARTIDWLREKYGVLIIVSAGNHGSLTIDSHSPVELRELRGSERAQVVRDAVMRQSMNRRLLSPAESINALTVAAVHDDQAGPVPIGYRFDPADGLPMVNPVSALGRGQRRSVKPDIAASGGRTYFRDPVGTEKPVVLKASPTSSTGPGIRTAAPLSQGSYYGEGYVTGTSPAAALASRRATLLWEQLSARSDWRFNRRQTVATVKALMVHGARWPRDIDVEPFTPDQLFGYGVLSRDLATGCDSNEATVIFAGEIAANEEHELRVPLPAGLQQVGTKRVVATLAWFSPINWRHRQYRRAKLEFVAPRGLDAGQLSPSDVGAVGSKRGTVQQQVYETAKVSAAHPDGDPLVVKIRCSEQAGGLGGVSVTYGAAISFWVAPELGVSVYDDVSVGIQQSLPVQLRSS